MPIRHIKVEDEIPEQLLAGLEKLRDEAGVPDEFDRAVTDAADQAAANPRLPENDLTDVEFVTIDPPGARDLDQAVHIARSGDGFLVRYAIADVAAFVNAGDPIDQEAHRRGQTFYAPHRRTPLHPPRLSEDAASLLADQVRPALVWHLPVAADGSCTEPSVQRALVRSRAQLTYQQVQEQLDGGTASESLQLLREVGQLREKVEIERGGVSLNVPSQEVHNNDGEWSIAFEQPLPVEGWNAQISLLTGIAAAQLMIGAKVGLLRTLPPASDESLAALRSTAAGLGLDWPEQQPYAEFVRALDITQPNQLAMMYACTSLFRGAGYAAFDGEVPEQPLHAALATEYSHTTAPLRRLVDRYVGELCLAISAGQAPPQWVLDALPGLPDEMEASDTRAARYERGIVDLTETLHLQNRVGQEFDGIIVRVDADKPDKGRVLIADPATEANVTGANLQLGSRVRGRLTEADLATGVARFELV